MFILSSKVPLEIRAFRYFFLNSFGKLHKLFTNAITCGTVNKHKVILCSAVVSLPTSQKRLGLIPDGETTLIKNQAACLF